MKSMALASALLSLVASRAAKSRHRCAPSRRERKEMARGMAGNVRRNIGVAGQAAYVEKWLRRAAALRSRSWQARALCAIRCAITAQCARAYRCGRYQHRAYRRAYRTAGRRRTHGAAVSRSASALSRWKRASRVTRVHEKHGGGRAHLAHGISRSCWQPPGRQQL